MRFFLLLLICLLWLMPGLAQKWVKVTSSDSFMIEIDLASIKKDGNLTYVWERHTYTDPEKRMNYINRNINRLEDGKSITLDVLKKWENYSHTLCYCVYNAGTEECKSLYVVDYSTRGESLYSYEFKYSEYSRLIPGSVGMGVFEAITNMWVYEVDGRRAFIATQSVGEFLKRYPDAKFIGFKSDI